ncbi:MAG TPA: polysaccharide deacetylase family protein [Acidimicrobiales bacterium]|nr:polysaccharide deacetylase family protein [Acidimicrobiales bacterium]
MSGPVRRRFLPSHLTLLAAGTAAASAILTQVGPALTALPAVRRTLSPRLTGLGRADHVALTFDDGPDPASTPQFLSELDRLGWKATFFMLGSMARRSGGLAAEVAAAGHEVAVHGDVHLSQVWRTPSAVIDDARRARDTLAELTGTTPRWMRPPYGTISGAGPEAARRAGLELVLWTAWGRDWRAEATPPSVVDDIATDMVPGGTVLLHDSDCTSAPGAWRSALGALPRLNDVWTERGWTVGPLRDHGLSPGRVQAGPVSA